MPEAPKNGPQTELSAVCVYAMSSVDMAVDVLMSQPPKSLAFKAGCILGAVSSAVLRSDEAGSHAAVDEVAKLLSVWAREQVVDGRKVGDIAKEAVERFKKDQASRNN